MAEKQLTISLVDREGNKKAVSVSVPTGAEARIPAFITAFEAFTGCKVLGSGVSEATTVVGDTYTPGDYDLVGEVANLRFKRVSDNKSFVFKIPGPIDAAIDAEEEVTAVFAEDVKGALETLWGTPDGLQYRGGKLVEKDVSKPVKIPDLEAA